MTFIGMIASYAFIVVERNGLERLFDVLPVLTRSLVYGRYLFMMALAVVTLVVNMTAQPLIAKAMGFLFSGNDLAFGAVTGFFVFAVLVGAQIPGYYKYGYIKGKIFLYLPAAAVIIIVVVTNYFNCDFQTLAPLPLLTEVSAHPWMLGLAVVAVRLGFFFVSAAISVGIVKSKVR